MPLSTGAVGAELEALLAAEELALLEDELEATLDDEDDLLDDELEATLELAALDDEVEVPQAATVS